MNVDIVYCIKLMHFLCYFHYMKMRQIAQNYYEDINEAYLICFDEPPQTQHKIQTKISDFFKLKNE